MGVWFAVQGGGSFLAIRSMCVYTGLQANPLAEAAQMVGSIECAFFVLSIGRYVLMYGDRFYLFF